MSAPPRWVIPEGHDPKSCPTCGPYMTSTAYKRGVARAEAAAAKTIEGMDREDA